ncbi:MAG: GDSL-type esterase/lipase family protein [Microbacteriaceae bacterium]
MRIVVVAETFLPQMNGVVNSVLQIVRHLREHGHEVLVIAPGVFNDTPPDEVLHGAEIELLRSMPLPRYAEVRLTFVSPARLSAILTGFAPDVVHLASPFILGWQALRVAQSLSIPVVAVYQTDIPRYARRYGIGIATATLTRHLARIHRTADVTLAPSTAAMTEIAALGVDRLALWARGVDGVRFTPARRSDGVRRRLAPGGEVVIGYVGRLAPEKQVDDLVALAAIANTRLVIIGDGPSRAALEVLLPDALFLGFQSGDDLADVVANFDVFVHPGENETFCQTVQEALASGVPVVATGVGGPVDLVHNSRTGWLYRPGDLGDLRSRVIDLVGDPSKRRAFGLAARSSVAHRTWSRLGDELLGHYRSLLQPGGESPARAPWQRFIAVGDSLTEGLSDSSRQAAGAYRGWADRLAELMAHSGDRRRPLLYANLAVRSRRIDDVVNVQIPRALALRPDVVSVLAGANDLVRGWAKPELLARQLLSGVERVRSTGAHVILVTAFAPHWPYLRGLHSRIDRFNRVVRTAASDPGVTVVDFARDSVCAEPGAWGADRVHLSSHGHRVLAYRAASSIGLPGMHELGDLDAVIHDELDSAASQLRESELSNSRWLWQHVRPWVGRRMIGRVAGHGRFSKHDELVPVNPLPRTQSDVRIP